MPSDNIVDLDELVPDDIQFRYRGDIYRIPGDLKTEKLLELYKYMQQLAGALDTDLTPARAQKIAASAESALLPIFQVLQPDMTELPFGAQSLGHVIRTLLMELRFIAPITPQPEEDDNRPPTRRTTKTTGKKMAVPKNRKRSGSSTGSKS